MKLFNKFLVALSLGAVAQATIVPSFNRLDKDFDDFISYEEASESEVVGDNFNKIDNNNDNKLSEDEFERLKEIVAAEAKRQREIRLKEYNKRNNNNKNKNKKNNRNNNNRNNRR